MHGRADLSLQAHNLDRGNFCVEDVGMARPQESRGSHSIGCGVEKTTTERGHLFGVRVETLIPLSTVVSLVVRIGGGPVALHCASPPPVSIYLLCLKLFETFASL